MGGSRVQERLLLGLLAHYYASRLRYQWKWVTPPEVPHFFEHRIGFFELVFGEPTAGPYPFYRAFFASDVIQAGDHLLDLGCGDGFFTKRFCAPRCAHVDGVDIEPSAIETARAQNSAPNITYHLLDATTATWPRDRYDVIVWDGALGHFSGETTAVMLRKIATAIGSSGIFVGSESLGREGSDHLQFFDSVDDLRRMFAPHFKHVAIRQQQFPILNGTFLRNEAYWRCTQDSRRLEYCDWELAE